MMSVPQLCVLTLHPTSHSNEECILNSIFYQNSFRPGDLIQVYDPEHPDRRLITRVPNQPATQSTLEVSIQKPVAEAVNLVQFSKVVVDNISEEEATLDFVELSFKKQYLQRGNMFRFKQGLLGRTVYLNQNVTVLNMQAQIQDIKKGLNNKQSGLITEQTKFVFRSKSARIIWLVQISSEMWDIDQNGELYFDKFLKEYVGPVFDSWKGLGVSHMLTVIFFARTIFLDRITATSHPEFTSKKSVNYNNGYHQQDFLKIVVENILDIDKVSLIKQLKHEFWAFPQILGWRIPHWRKQQQNNNYNQNESSKLSSSSNSGTTTVGNNEYFDDVQPRQRLLAATPIQIAVPSDSVHGNFLGAINTSLNILEKHYMDRDLQRTGNSIVMISAGCGVFKVKPYLSQITKQRMLDSAFGIDFISLSRPPLHTVPLFIVSSPVEGGKDFYEMPHWMRVSYVDRKKDLEFIDTTSALNVITNWKTNPNDRDLDQLWSRDYLPHPLSFVLTSILTYSSNLQSLVKSYIQHLPFALKELLYHLCEQNGPCRSLLIKVDGEDGKQEIVQTSADTTPRNPSSSGVNYNTNSNSNNSNTMFITPTPTPPLPPTTISRTPSSTGVIANNSTLICQPNIPMWGKIDFNKELENNPELNKKSGLNSYSTKTMILQQDIVKIRLVSQKFTNENSGFTNTTKRLLMDILDSVPSLKREREDSIATSYNSVHDGLSAGDELDESHHNSNGNNPVSKSSGSNVSGSYDDRSLPCSVPLGNPTNVIYGEGKGTTMNGRRLSATGHLLPIHIENGNSEQVLRLDPSTPNKSSSSTLSQQYYQNIIDNQSKLLDLFTGNKRMTKEQLQDVINSHDSLYNHIFARYKPDPNAPPPPPPGSGNGLSVTIGSTTNIDGIACGPDGVAISSGRLSNASSVGDSNNNLSGSVSSQPTKGILKNGSSTNLNQDPNFTPLSSSLKSSSFKEQPFLAKSPPQLIKSPMPPTTSTTTTNSTAAEAIPINNNNQIPNKAVNENIKTAYMRAVMGKGGSGPRHMFTPAQFRGGHIPPNMDPRYSTPPSRSGLSEKLATVSEHSGSSKETNENTSEKMMKTTTESNANDNYNNLVATGGVETTDGQLVKENIGIASVSPTKPTGPPTASGPIPPYSMTKRNKLSSKNFIARNQIIRGNGNGNTSSNSSMMGRNGPRGHGNGNGNAADEPETVDFVIEHGKLVPIPVVDNLKKKKEELLEYMRNYANQYAINPFREKEGEKYLNLVTHNRRRWSHVFPNNKNEKLLDFNLNWKSLTQPAILPLTTDYLPSVKDLDRNYNVHQYILTIDKYECPFPNLESALQELVCQRLSREFQLVEGFDKSAYIRFNKYDTVINDAKKREAIFQHFYILTMGHRIHFLLGDIAENQIYVTSYLSKKAQTHEEQDGKESTENHIDSLTSFHYNYEMWLAHLKKFQTVSQKFYQFPKKEYLWNRLDNLIIGNVPYDPSLGEELKPRYVHFIIIPKNICNESEMNEYYSKIEQLCEIINKYSYDKNEDLMFIQKDKTLLQYSNPISNFQSPIINSENNNASSTPTSSSAGNSAATSLKEPSTPILIKPSTLPPFTIPSSNANIKEKDQVILNHPLMDYWINKPIHYYKRTSSEMNVVRCLMRGKESGNPNWMYFKYDKNIYSYKAFHIEIQWYVCDSWLIDDFVTLLYRRCGRFGLRLVQTPAYFNSNSLNIHPYRPAPYIYLPSNQLPPTPPPPGNQTSSLATALGGGGGGGGGSNPPSLVAPANSAASNTSNNNNNNNNANTPSSGLTTTSSTASLLPPINPPLLSSGSSNNLFHSTSSNPHGSAISIPFILSSSIRLIERLYFIHSPDWIFDGEECTKWDLLGLPTPNYPDRDRDIVYDEILNPNNIHPLLQRATSTSSSSSTGPVPSITNPSSNKASNELLTPKPVGSSITKSFQRMIFRSKSGEEDLIPISHTPTPEPIENTGGNPLTPGGGGGANSNGPPSVGRMMRSDSTSMNSNNNVNPNSSNNNNLLSSTSGGGGGGSNTPGNSNGIAANNAGGNGTHSSGLLKFGTEKSWNKRIDRQYVHVLGIATVRVGPNGFLWFASSTTKLSDINMSVDEKTVISMKALKQLEFYCNHVNDCYEILLDMIDKVFFVNECKINALCPENADQLEQQQQQQLSTSSPSPQNQSMTRSPPISPNVTPNTTFYSRNNNNSNANSPSRTAQSGNIKHFASESHLFPSVMSGGPIGGGGSSKSSSSNDLHQVPSTSPLGPRAQSLKLDMDLIHNSSNTNIAFQPTMPSYSDPASAKQQSTNPPSSTSTKIPTVTPTPLKGNASNALKGRGQSRVESSSGSSSSDEDEENSTIQVIYSRDSRDSQDVPQSSTTTSSHHHHNHQHHHHHSHPTPKQGSPQLSPYHSTLP